jgi:hypothetical protein
MSDNKHSSSSLCDSEVLSIKHPVAPPIAEFNQRSEEGSKIPSFVGTEDTWHIFPNEPLGSKLVKNSNIGKGKVSPWIFKSFSKTSD